MDEMPGETSPAPGSEIALEDPASASDQDRLLKLQALNLEEEHPFRVAHLQAQLLDLRIRRFNQRLHNALQLMVVSFTALIGVALAILVADAVTSRSVMVEVFDAPPALAARGASGKVVASGVLDALTRLQSATRSKAAKRHLANAWSREIEIEVPQTGVSIGELQRVLRGRFGHDLHISGGLVQDAAGGLSLTVRGDGMDPATFRGAPDSLERLQGQAAEYVFGQSQPSIYASYLIETGRSSEAVDFSRALFPKAEAADKPYLLNQWANALQNTGGSVDQAIHLYQRAIALKPDYWAAYSNIILSQVVQGREQQAYETGVELRRIAGGRPGRATELAYQAWDELTWNLRPWRAGLVADADANRGAGSGNQLRSPRIAVIDTRLHDPAQARFQLSLAASAGADPTADALDHFVRGRLAAEAGRPAEAAAEMEAFLVAYEDKTVATNFPGYACWAALAIASAGNAARADAVLAGAGRHVDCLRFRADMLAQRGDWLNAKAAYAQAVAAAPDLPAGYYAWGMALARRGDLAGAAGKFAAAQKRGPGWADPVKAWGDVLARQGRWRAAEQKYAEAARLAPQWDALRRARAAVAARQPPPSWPAALNGL